MSAFKPETAQQAIELLVWANRILVNEDIFDYLGHVSVRNPQNPKTFFIARAIPPEAVTNEDILEVDQESLTSTYGKFVAEPFERGFGTTVGNSLRRILLSSLQGAAVTAVRIKGVLHEFSTLPGVREDVTDILLNLKEIRCKLHDGTQETARIEAKGERVVRAGEGGPAERAAGNRGFRRESPASVPRSVPAQGPGPPHRRPRGRKEKDGSRPSHRRRPGHRAGQGGS
jgi:hypothetical protein